MESDLVNPVGISLEPESHSIESAKDTAASSMAKSFGSWIGGSALTVSIAKETEEIEVRVSGSW